jgi:hypothetical protein
MSTTPNNLDEQKLLLERDRLAFEIRKYDDDRPKREKELAKLDEEVRELRKQWYRKAVYLGPVATVIVAIVAGLIAFGTDFLKSDLLELHKSVSGLKSEKDQLSGEKDQLTRDVQELKQNTASLTRQNLELSEGVRLAALKTHLEILRSVPAGGLAASASLGQLFALAERNRGRSATVSALLAAYADTRASIELKCVLSQALFKATGKPEWKSRARGSSLQAVVAQLDSPSLVRGLNHQSIFLRLLADGTVFTRREKVAFLKTMYDVIKTKSYELLDIRRQDTESSDEWARAISRMGIPCGSSRYGTRTAPSPSEILGLTTSVVCTRFVSGSVSTTKTG